MKLKRFLAYFIDIMIVGLVASSLANIRVINPYYDEYLEVQDKIREAYKDVNEDNILDVVFKEDNINLYRDLSKVNSITSIISVCCYVLYFVGFQKWNKDQTVGKKLMGIKVVSVDKKEVSGLDYLIRSVFVYNLLFTSLNVWVAFRFSGNMYLNLTSIFSSVGSLITLVTYLMILVRSDGRGLHDIVGHTKVVLDNE